MTRLILVFLISVIAGPEVATAQMRHAKQHQIPDSINSFLRNSCISCHGMNGGRFPRARLNLARWGEYGASKQVEKALLICSALRKEAMPPKSFRESHTELIPSKEQTEMICRWAQSLKENKGRRQPKN